MIITIDGPAASGKSTVARILADKYSYYYLNSGLLFRGLAYLLVHYASYTQDTIAHPRAADVDWYLCPSRFAYTYTQQEGAGIHFKNINITEHLKTELIDQYASMLSASEYVRKKLYELQRTLACHHNVVVDGRDAGSVVFPDADYKFFITASVEVRAQRWQKDHAKKGTSFSYEHAVAAITERDRRDSMRKVAPLVVPPDAYVIDSSDLSVAQTVRAVDAIIKS